MYVCAAIMCCRLATKIVKAQNAVQQLGGNTAAKVRRQQNDLEHIHSARCTFALAEVRTYVGVDMNCAV